MGDGGREEKAVQIDLSPPAPSFFFKSPPSQECSLRMALISLIRLPPSLHRAPDLCHSAITRITRNSLYYNLGWGGGGVRGRRWLCDVLLGGTQVQKNLGRGRSRSC